MNKGDNDILVSMRHFLKILIFLTLLVASAGSYAYYFVIPSEIENNIKQQLGSLGFKNVTFTAIEKQKGAIILKGVSLDAKSFSGIESLTIHYTLWDYLFHQKKAESLEVKNLKLTGELSNDIVLNLVGWKNDGKLLKTLSNIPSKKIIFQNSSLDLLAPAIGGLKFEYEGEIKQNEAGEMEIAGVLKTRQKKIEGHARISGTVNQKGSLEIQAQCENFKIETEALTVRRASLSATILVFSDTIPRLALEANAGSVLWQGLPLQDANITLEKNNDNIQLFAEGKTPGVNNAEFSAQISVTGDNSTLEATIYPESVLDLVNYLKNNRYIAKDRAFPKPFLDIKKPTIYLEGKSIFDDKAEGLFKLSPASLDYEITGNYLLDFQNKKTSGSFYLPRSFVPVFSEGYKSEKNTSNKKNILSLSSNGEYSYDYSLPSAPALNWALQTKVEPSTLELHGITLNNIAGRLTLNSTPSESATEENWPKLSFQLPLSPWCVQSGEITLDLLTPDLPVVKNLKLSLFDGAIQTGPLSLNSRTPPEKIIIDINDVSLSDVSKALLLNDSAMIGKAGGKIPVHIENGLLSIKKGLFQSQQSGVIKIPEELSSIYFPGDAPKMQEVRNTIKNFHFEFFEIRIDGPIDGLVMMSILAKGTHPNDKGMENPVNLDFKIEGRLPEILKNIIAK